MFYSDLSIHSSLHRALGELGYVELTPIQEQTIPLILADKDVIGIAQTGTGKTAAFSIPLLQKIYGRVAKPHKPLALIIAPTRELVVQITTAIDQYAKYARIRCASVFGGVNQSSQVRHLSRGVEILVATPGRLQDLIQQKKIFLSDVEFFVLDEADRMLDMGFIPDIKRIAALLRSPQTVLFSATWSSTIDALSASLTKNVTRIELSQATVSDNIHQRVLYVRSSQRDELLFHLFSEQHMEKVLVFTQMKHRADKVASFLSKKGFPAVSIHGDKSQKQRMRALADFVSGKVSILVATDVAARGIDVDNISHVINYELPTDPESYVHRIGRTARAGASGVAYSFCSETDKALLESIQKAISDTIEHEDHKFHSAEAMHAKILPKMKKRRFRHTQNRFRPQRRRK